MKSLLWFDRFVPLDDNSTASGGNVFKPAAYEYLDFGDANQAYMTVEYWAVGPGAASVELQFQRSATREDSDAVFEDMTMVGSPLTRGNAVINLSFGADGAVGNLYPLGIGRFTLTNTSVVAGEFAAVRLRVSVALVNG